MLAVRTRGEDWTRTARYSDVEIFTRHRFDSISDYVTDLSEKTGIRSRAVPVRRQPRFANNIPGFADYRFVDYIYDHIWLTVVFTERL